MTTRIPRKGNTVYQNIEPIPPIEKHIDSMTMEGIVDLFQDVAADSRPGALALKSRRKILCRLVRNVSSGELRPGQKVWFQAGYYSRRVIAAHERSRSEGGAYAGRVDTACTESVRQNDLFWCEVPVRKRKELEESMKRWKQ